MEGKANMARFQQTELLTGDGADGQSSAVSETAAKREGYTVNLRGAEVDFAVAVQAELKSLGVSAELSQAARGVFRAAHSLGLAKMLAATIAVAKPPAPDSRPTSTVQSSSLSSIDVEALLIDRAKQAPFFASARDIIETTPALHDMNVHQIDAALRSIAKHSTRLTVRQAGKRNVGGKGTCMLWSFVLAQKPRTKG